MGNMTEITTEAPEDVIIQEEDTDTDPEMSIEEENIGEAVEEEETEMDVLDEVPEEILEEEITEWQMKQKGLEGLFYQFLVE